MRVYISNYSRYKGDKAVQISATKPDWAVCYKSIHELYPTWEMIKSIKDTRELDPEDIRRVTCEKQYTEAYLEILNRNKDKILEKLDDGDVCLCWCARNAFCHRYILKDWLNENGIVCKEV